MPDKVTLTITEGRLPEKQFVFDARSICIVGRDDNCKIQIPNHKDHYKISRYHCLLDINPPDIRIRDFGSLNGTSVNGKCIGRRENHQNPSQGAKLNLSEYDLRDGDLIQLGETTTFRVNIETALTKTEIVHYPNKPNKFLPAIEDPFAANSNINEHYTKIKQLGAGGFGEVYLARHNKTGEQVAIKTLLPRIAAKPYMKKMFMREVENTKMLDHPNLISPRDFGFSGDLFFLVMEYCNCGSVSDFIKVKKSKLTIEEATNIIFQVLDGLNYAHTKLGLVHRDIKPDNIFLTVKDGKLVAKLGDYGLAKNFDLAGLSGQTMTGTAMGTPSFMSRKQVLNFKYAKPDLDVWAVAASLYFMLTLKHPRDLVGIEPMLGILKTQPIPILERDASLPYTLATLIDSTLKDDSQLRFQTAKDFKQALLLAVQNATHATWNVINGRYS